MDVLQVLGIVGGILSVTIGVAFSIGRKVDKFEFIRCIDKIDETILNHIKDENRKFDKIFDKMEEIRVEIKNGGRR